MVVAASTARSGTRQSAAILVSVETLSLEVQSAALYRVLYLVAATIKPRPVVRRFHSSAANRSRPFQKGHLGHGSPSG